MGPGEVPHRLPDDPASGHHPAAPACTWTCWRRRFHYYITTGYA